MAVGLGLAGPQQIEVRAVEHVNRLGSCLGHPNPGNAAAGGAVIGNNKPKGKPLGRPTHPSNASSGSQKGAQNLRKSFVKQCKRMAALILAQPWVHEKGRASLPAPNPLSSRS